MCGSGWSGLCPGHKCSLRPRSGPSRGTAWGGVSAGGSAVPWPAGCGPRRGHRAAPQPPSALLVAQQRQPPAGRSVAEVNRPPLLGTPGGAVPEGVGPRRVFCRGSAQPPQSSPPSGRGGSLSRCANRARCRQRPGGSGSAAGLREAVGGRWHRWRSLNAGWGEPLGGWVAVGAAAPACLPLLAGGRGGVPFAEGRAAGWEGDLASEGAAVPASFPQRRRETQRLPEGAVGAGGPRGKRLQGAGGAPAGLASPSPTGLVLFLGGKPRQAARAVTSLSRGVFKPCLLPFIVTRKP